MKMKRICSVCLLLACFLVSCAEAASFLEEEAVQIAKEKYLQSAQKRGWPLLDLDVYDTRCSQAKNPDGTTTWSVDFLSPEYDVPFTEVEASVFEKPKTASIVWNDPDMFIHKYQIWRREHGHEGFRAWPLDIQAAFYQELLRVKGYHTAKYGQLEDMYEWQDYVKIISRVHDVPGEGEVQPDAALNLAREYLIQKGVEPSRLRGFAEYVSFYRDEPNQPEYEMWYFESKADEQPLYSVIVNAVTGEIKEA